MSICENVDIINNNDSLNKGFDKDFDKGSGDGSDNGSDGPEILVLSGGGLKGYSFIGVIKALTENNKLNNINTIAASSIGSFISLLYCIGYTTDEMENVFTELDLDTTKDITTDNILNFLTNYGIDSGNKLTRLIEMLIQNKLGSGSHNITFYQLFKYTGYNLIVTGTCINTRETEYFNYTNTPNMKVSLAIRISTSLPFYFHPVYINQKIYIDGGVIDYFPIDLFKDRIDKCIGAIILSYNEKTPIIKDMISYTYAIYECLVPNNAYSQYICYKDRCIGVNIHDVNIYNLEMNSIKRKELIKSGYDSVMKQLSNLK